MNAKKLEDNVSSLIESVGFIKDNMATKDDIANMATKDDIADMATKHDLKILETKIDHTGSKLGAFENTEVYKRKQLEVKVMRLEKKIGV